MTPQIRTAVRRVFGLENNRGVPVKIAQWSNMEPRIYGEKGGHFTRGGSKIWHPSAYSRKGWSNMVYHCSTRFIIVGENWVKFNLGA